MTLLPQSPKNILSKAAAHFGMICALVSCALIYCHEEFESTASMRNLIPHRCTAHQCEIFEAR
jgi:hypothetical protein